MQTLRVPEKLVFASQNPYKFVVIGCGGTGSYLIRDLARIIGITNKQFNRSDTILLIDGDVVENKNLARQNFVLNDVSKNKAQVLAGRYSSAFGLQIGFISEYLRGNNLTCVTNDGCTLVYIGCVDNNKTRHLIHNLYRKTIHSNAIYIDSGNEEYAGQVVLSATSGYTTNGNNISLVPNPYNSNSPYIKDAVEMFTLEANDRHPDELSCAEHSVSSPQNIATNIMAANVIFNYCNAILSASANVLYRANRNLEIYESYKTVRAVGAHVTYFNSKTGTTSIQGFENDVCTVIERTKKNRESQITEEKSRLSVVK